MVEVGSSNLLIPTRRGKEIGDSTCLENKLPEIWIAGSIPVLGAMFLSPDFQANDQLQLGVGSQEYVEAELSEVSVSGDLSNTHMIIDDEQVDFPLHPNIFPVSYNGEKYGAKIVFSPDEQTLIVKRTFREARAGSAFIYQGVPKTSDDMTFDLTQFDKSSYVVLLLYAIGVLDDRKP